MGEEYNFVKFEANNSRIETRISLNKSSTIGLPTAFYQAYHLVEYKYAVLYFDSEKWAVAIRFTNSAEAGIFKVIHDKKGRGAKISIRSFLKTYNINPMVHSGKYLWKKAILPGGYGFIFKLDIKKDPESYIRSSNRSL